MRTLFEDVARDLRHAWRLLRRTRGFTAIAVLAISIGANTAVFSVINSLLLRPLPYPEADRIVQPAPNSSKVRGGSSASWPIRATRK